MDAELFVGRVLEDEGIRGDLNDPEATALVERLVALVEKTASTATSEDEAWPRVTALVQSGRAIARAVALFEDGDSIEARRIATAAKISWPAREPGSSAELLRYFLEHLTVA